MEKASTGHLRLLTVKIETPLVKTKKLHAMFHESNCIVSIEINVFVLFFRLITEIDTDSGGLL